MIIKDQILFAWYFYLNLESSYIIRLLLAKRFENSYLKLIKKIISKFKIVIILDYDNALLATLLR